MKLSFRVSMALRYNDSARGNNGNQMIKFWRIF